MKEGLTTKVSTKVFVRVMELLRFLMVMICGPLNS